MKAYKGQHIGKAPSLHLQTCQVLCLRRESRTVQVILMLSCSDTQISRLFQCVPVPAPNHTLFMCFVRERCAKLKLSKKKGAALQNKFCNVIYITPCNTMRPHYTCSSISAFYSWLVPDQIFHVRPVGSSGTLHVKSLMSKMFVHECTLDTGIHVQQYMKAGAARFFDP